jgi:hypothetical protein
LTPAGQSIRVRYDAPRNGAVITKAGVTLPVTRRLRQSHALLSHGAPLPKHPPLGQQHRNCSAPHMNV